ncbi:hypothetical protein HY024_03175 [Candidatus Curtissbacteria bacterium]|nr:hypothetical protein [Candidatus Curtissbacteria bacterium]
MANLTTELFVLCDYASISQEQKLSVIGIFDQFFAANIPTTWPRMFLVAVLKGEPGKQYPLTLKLVSPAPDQNFPEKTVEVSLGNNGKANLLTELVNFPLNAPGVHKFEITTSNEVVGRLEFNVTKTTASYDGQIAKKPAN